MLKFVVRHVIRFYVESQDAVALGEHFRKARTAMRKIGFPVKMMHREFNDDSDIAKTWLAAAGDVDTFLSWAESEDFPFRLCDAEDRVMSIINHILSD